MKCVTLKDGTRLWRVSSRSEPGRRYRVTQKLGKGYLRCECKGFQYHNTCRHIAKVEADQPPSQDPKLQFLAAWSYAKMGYHVIPVVPNGKRPLVNWKNFQHTAPTIDQVCNWWSKWPHANVGIVLGKGRIVIDLDGGHDAEQLLADAGIELPADAPRAQTRNGYHVYLSVASDCPDRVALLQGTKVKKSMGMTAKGQQRYAQVDVRGQGMAIAPPSIHESGHIYSWLTPLTAQLPRAPKKLLTLVRKAKPTRSKVA